MEPQARPLRNRMRWADPRPPAWRQHGGRASGCSCATRGGEDAWRRRKRLYPETRPARKPCWTSTRLPSWSTSPTRKPRKSRTPRASTLDRVVGISFSPSPARGDPQLAKKARKLLQKLLNFDAHQEDAKRHLKDLVARFNAEVAWRLMHVVRFVSFALRNAEQLLQPC